jgi:hypothetical protein
LVIEVDDLREQPCILGFVPIGAANFSLWTFSETCPGAMEWLRVIVVLQKLGSVSERHASLSQSITVANLTGAEAMPKILLSNERRRLSSWNGHRPWSAVARASRYAWGLALHRDGLRSLDHTIRDALGHERPTQKPVKRVC